MRYITERRTSKQMTLKSSFDKLQADLRVGLYLCPRVYFHCIKNNASYYFFKFQSIDDTTWAKPNKHTVHTLYYIHFRVMVAMETNMFLLFF